MRMGSRCDARRHVRMEAAWRARDSSIQPRLRGFGATRRRRRNFTGFRTQRSSAQREWEEDKVKVEKGRPQGASSLAVPFKYLAYFLFIQTQSYANNLIYTLASLYPLSISMAPSRPPISNKPSLEAFLILSTFTNGDWAENLCVLGSICISSVHTTHDISDSVG
ncbi:hypothetical protein BJ912DRAFT_633021 [Pholiota molesta]|nr:hypothetical protein BJ912DRAFT_633021 [Pholiota molesta]